MFKRIFVVYVLILLFPEPADAQWPVMKNGRLLNPADKTMPYKHVDFSGSLINYVDGDLWQFTFSGGIPLFNEMHELSVEFPMIRSVYTGIENLSGIGDIKVNYKVLTYESKRRVRTLASSSLYGSFSFPTGDSFSGHGAGVPVFSPGFRLAYRPVDQIAIYPNIKYTHSFGDADFNSYTGGGFDPNSNTVKIRYMQAEILFNAELNEAWIGIAPEYVYDFQGSEGTLNLRPELGKLFSDIFYLKLSGSLYVAGRRRIINSTMFQMGLIF